MFKKQKYWPSGWYLSPSERLKSRDGVFYVFLKFGIAIFVAGFLILSLILGTSLFQKVQTIQDKLSYADLKKFEIVWREFGADLKLITANSTVPDEKYSALQALSVINRDYNDISKNINNLKLIYKDFDLVIAGSLAITDFLKKISNPIFKIDENLHEIKNLIDIHAKFFYSNKKFTYYSAYFDDLVFLLDKFKAHFDGILDVLGDRYPRRGVVLLQNNYEIRPTGGFIGAYLNFDINEGYITNIKYSDVYEHDGQLGEIDKKDIPEEIAEIAGSKWGIRDGNYSPDFAISALQVEKLMQEAKEDSSDPVIAIDLTVVKDLLKILGPIHLKDFNFDLNDENFDTFLSFIVESKYSSENNPKKIFHDLIPMFLDKLKTDKLNPIDLSILMSTLINEKHIQAFSKNSNIQKFFDDYGVSGKIKAPSYDYFQMVEISIGGNKTDKWIQQSISHNTLIQKDGTMVDEVHIKRKNIMNEVLLAQQLNFLVSIGFNDIDQTIQDILFTGTNKNRFRIYVPKNSILKDVKGLSMEDVKTKFDKDLQLSYFAFEANLRPNEEQEIVLAYKLPFKLSFFSADTYRLKLAKQAGTDNFLLTKTFKIDPSLKIYKVYPENFDLSSPLNINYNGLVRSDIEFGAVLGR